MHGGRKHDRFIILATTLLFVTAGYAERTALSQTPKRVARIPGIDPVPCNPGNGMTVNDSEGVLVGYRWYEAKNQEPLFPFGHGLSYTTFDCSDLQVTHSSGSHFAVNVWVANTGTREGAEVVQLYLSAASEAGVPPKQLKGFEKIVLKPGKSRPVTFERDEGSLATRDANIRNWRVDAGACSVMVGSSSRDIRLKNSFSINMNY
jgi:beta-glucosidase